MVADWRRIFFVILVLFLALALLQASVSAYCTGDACDNGAYKTDLNDGGDGPCDMTVNYYKQGTLYNKEAGTTNNDYCKSSSVLREYYIECMGIGKKDITHYIDYTCPSGYQCSGGACKSDPCQGVTCSNYCGSGDVRYYNGYCSGGACYYSSSYDCDNYDQYFCDTGNVRKFKDGYCSGGGCYTSTSTVEDCDNYDTGWTYYCEGSCVKRKKQDYYCSGSSCTYSWVYENVECNGDDEYCNYKNNGYSGCGTGCSHGEYDCDWDSECSSGLVCKGPIAGSADGCCYSDEYWDGNAHKCVQCTKASDCGSDGYVGSNYCSNGDVYRDYKTYICSSGTCSSSTSPILQDDCPSNEKCPVDKCVAKTCEEQGYDKGSCGNLLNTACFDNGIYHCDSIGNQWCWVHQESCGSNGQCIDPPDPVQGADCYYCSDYQNTGGMCSAEGQTKCESGNPWKCKDQIIIGVFLCWEQTDTCDQYQKCSGDSCVDLTCEEMGHPKGSCTGIDPTKCLDGVDGDAYACQDVGHKKCWVLIEDCDQDEKCYDPTGFDGAQCWACSEFSGTTGEQCFDYSDNYKECRNGDVHICNDQVLWGEILCWEVHDDCSSIEYCEDAECKPYCGDGQCQSWEDHENCWDDCIPPPGHKDYCKWKYDHGQKCGHGEYDCDELATYDECDTSIGLDCMGSWLPGGGLDGCCYTGTERWNGDSYQCCQLEYGLGCYDNDVYWYDSCGNVEDGNKEYECGKSEYTGDNYCGLDGDVYRDYISRGCSSSSCTESTGAVPQDDCDQHQRCSGGSCIDLTCEEMGYSEGSCTGLNPTKCENDDAYECQAVGHKYCWVMIDNCSEDSEYCVDPFGKIGAHCEETLTISFSGTVKYWDREEYKYYLLRGAKVELQDKDTIDDDFVDEATIDDNGQFTFTGIHTENLDGSGNDGDAGDLYVKVVMESPIVAVSEAWNPTIIDYKSEVHQNVLSDKNITVHIGSSSSPAYHPESGAANIMDVIRSAYLKYKSYDSGWTKNQAFVELHNEDSWICKLLSFIGIGDCSGAHFETRFKDEIHIYGDDIWSDSTIAHEYAHSVMYETYGNKWPQASLDLKEYNFIKQNGQIEKIEGHLAFSEMDRGFAMIEGWAEFMEAVDYGSSVQNPISDSEIWYTLGNSGLDINNDNIVNGSDIFHELTDLEENYWWTGEDLYLDNGIVVNPNDNTGDIVEGAVASILWDIYDSDNADELNGEGISDGFSKVWSIIREDNPDDIMEFWDYWFSTSDNTPTNYGDRNRLAYIYEMHGIDMCPDGDGDGYDDGACGGEDCNDDNNTIKPGATEICDFVDNNCDGAIDEGCVMICTSTSECGTDGWLESPECSGNEVWDTHRTWMCHYPGSYDSYCEHSDSFQFREPCGTSLCEGWGPDECWKGDVYRLQTCYEKGCADGECYSNQQRNEQLVQDCEYTCHDANCTQLNGDCNNDCKVNVFDLAAVGFSYGSTPGHQRWNAGADMNGDNKVDIFDLAAVGLNYGKTC